MASKKRKKSYWSKRSGSEKFMIVAGVLISISMVVSLFYGVF